MSESVDPFRMLRSQIVALERQRPGPACPLATTGHPGIDLALGGGLARGRLHELFAIDAADASSAAGFAAMLARGIGGGIVWLRQEDSERRGGALHAPGLVEIGIDPARLILAVLPDVPALLRAAADVVRCPGVGVAVIELWRDPPALDLTASRRLALTAEASGVTALLLRIAATLAPSAAQTRWAVRAAASVPLEANAPGQPALEIEVLRQRGRPAAGAWRVEWDRDRAILHEQAVATAPSGLVVPLPLSRSAAGERRVAHRRRG